MKEENKQFDAPAFNMGLAYLERVNDSLKMCTQAALQGNLMLWHRALKAVFRDVSSYLGDEDKETFLQYHSQVYLNPKPRTVAQELKHLSSEPDLEALDLFLREKIHKVGLIMPSKDDPSNVMFR